MKDTLGWILKLFEPLVPHNIHCPPHCSLSPSPHPVLTPFILCTSDFQSHTLVASWTILCTLSFGLGLSSNLSLPLSPFRGEVSRLPSSLWWPRASVSYTLSPPSCSTIFTVPNDWFGHLTHTGSSQFFMWLMCIIWCQWIGSIEEHPWNYLRGRNLLYLIFTCSDVVPMCIFLMKHAKVSWNLNHTSWSILAYINAGSEHNYLFMWLNNLLHTSTHAIFDEHLFPKCSGARPHKLVSHTPHKPHTTDKHKSVSEVSNDEVIPPAHQQQCPQQQQPVQPPSPVRTPSLLTQLPTPVTPPHVPHPQPLGLPPLRPRHS